MESGGQQGMQKMEQSLAELFVRGEISEQSVNALSRHPGQVFERAARIRQRAANPVKS